MSDPERRESCIRSDLREWCEEALDLDPIYCRQMKEPLQKAGIEWDWHGLRRGLATNLEHIGVMDFDRRNGPPALERTRLTRKHYIN